MTLQLLGPVSSVVAALIYIGAAVITLRTLNRALDSIAMLISMVSAQSKSQTMTIEEIDTLKRRIRALEKAS